LPSGGSGRPWWRPFTPPRLPVNQREKEEKLKLQITEYGKRRVASEDFAKTFVHVMAHAGEKRESGMPEEAMFTLVASYVAKNLIVDKDGVFRLPAGRKGEKVLARFMNENDQFIKDTILQTIHSPAFIRHA
jgi:hypothetical protein